MKKVILFFVLLASLLFVSCQKDGGLAGTNWQSQSGKITLQFKDAGVVTVILEDYSQIKRDSGQYSISGNNVTFTDLMVDLGAYAIYHFESGEINGNMMDVTYQYTTYGENFVSIAAFKIIN